MTTQHTPRDTCIGLSLGKFSTAKVIDIDETCVRLYRSSPDSAQIQLRLATPTGETAKRVRSMFASAPITFDECIALGVTALAHGGIDIAALLTRAANAISGDDIPEGELPSAVLSDIRAALAKVQA